MKVYSLTDLRAATLPPLEPIVEGLLNAGETILIVGRPKVGKSRLTHQLALDLSRGADFLGHFRITRPYRVAILDLENRANALQTRFASLSPASIGDDNIFICPAEVLADSSDVGVGLLKNFLNLTNADVLIIDTWRLFASGDENDAGSVVSALKTLSEIHKNWPQLGIILVHHLRKEKGFSRARLREDPFTWMDGVSGHHALVGHVDACFGFERDTDAQGEELVVFGGVARNWATTTLTLDEDDQTLLFKVQSGLEAALAVFTQKELDFYNIASAMKKFKFTDLVKKIGTTNRKAVASMLRKAKASKIITQHGDEYESLY